MYISADSSKGIVAHQINSSQNKIEFDDLGGIKEDQTLNSHNEACHRPLQPCTVLMDLPPKSTQYTLLAQ